jgi:hypothetical protein
MKVSHSIITTMPITTCIGLAVRLLSGTRPKHPFHLNESKQYNTVENYTSWMENPPETVRPDICDTWQNWRITFSKSLLHLVSIRGRCIGKITDLYRIDLNFSIAFKYACFLSPYHIWLKYRVIQKSLCTCKNTNIFLMVNLRLQHGTTGPKKVVVKIIWSRDSSHVRHLGRVQGLWITFDTCSYRCTGTFESSCSTCNLWTGHIVLTWAFNNNDCTNRRPSNYHLMIKSRWMRRAEYVTRIYKMRNACKSFGWKTWW